MLSIDKSILLHFLNFALIYGMFKYFLAGKVASAIKVRRDNINNQLKLAEDGRQEAEKLQAKMIKELDSAKQESREIISVAMKDSEEMKKHFLTEAKKSRQQMLDTGKMELSNLKQELQKDLKRETLNISASIAEKLIKQSLDPKVKRAVEADLRGMLN